jgi:DNA-binding CsgD family transcriptional regulator
LLMHGDLAGARALLTEVLAEAEAAPAPIWKMFCLAFLGHTLAIMGRPEEARAAAEASIAVAGDLGAVYEGGGLLALSVAAMAAGDEAALRAASQAAWRRLSFRPEFAVMCLGGVAEGDLAAGDLTAARQRADEAVALATGLNKYYTMQALLTSARVAIALGDLGQANDDAHQALVWGRSIDAQAGIADVLECLAGLAGDAGSHEEAARLFGAADVSRRRIGAVRFALYQAGYDADVSALRASMGDAAFERAWAEGTALSADEAVAYAQRGRGERKRPSSGWASLTPTERDVVRLVGEGLANKDIAALLFVSPRTVQSHLTHVYTKLGVTSRVQLAQEAARHA